MATEDAPSESPPPYSSKRRHSSLTEQIAEIIEDHLDLDHKKVTEDDEIAIERFYEMKDATSDIFTYTFFVMEALITLFLLGLIPQHFYIFQTFKTIILLSIRFYVFKQIGKHYFFVELCTWVHLLMLIYLWSPWKPKGMFPVIFLFANGPLIWAVLTWRNAFVPHSLEKMCTLFIHISPSMFSWSIRWYTTPEQGFELCADPTEPGLNGCNHVTLYQTLIDTAPYYIIWIIYYWLIVFVWRARTIKEEGYMTAFNLMTSKKGGHINKFYQVIRFTNPKYQKVTYLSVATVVYIFMAIMGFYCFYSLALHFIYIFLFGLLASYNGATFYIRVVGKKYYNSEEKQKEMKKD